MDNLDFSNIGFSRYVSFEPGRPAFDITPRDAAPPPLEILAKSAVVLSYPVVCHNRLMELIDPKVAALRALMVSDSRVTAMLVFVDGVDTSTQDRTLTVIRELVERLAI